MRTLLCSNLYQAKHSALSTLRGGMILDQESHYEVLCYLTSIGQLDRMRVTGFQYTPVFLEQWRPEGSTINLYCFTDEGSSRQWHNDAERPPRVISKDCHFINWEQRAGLIKNSGYEVAHGTRLRYVRAHGITPPYTKLPFNKQAFMTCLAMQRNFFDSELAKWLTQTQLTSLEDLTDYINNYTSGAEYHTDMTVRSTFTTYTQYLGDVDAADSAFYPVWLSSHSTLDIQRYLSLVMPDTHCIGTLHHRRDVAMFDSPNHLVFYNNNEIDAEAKELIRARYELNANNILSYMAPNINATNILQTAKLLGCAVIYKPGLIPGIISIFPCKKQPEWDLQRDYSLPLIRPLFNFDPITIDDV